MANAFNRGDWVMTSKRKFIGVVVEGGMLVSKVRLFSHLEEQPSGYFDINNTHLTLIERQVAKDLLTMRGIEFMNEELIEQVEDTLHMLKSWSEAYPTDIFTKPTQADYEHIQQVKGLSERLFADWGRHFIAKGFTPAIDVLEKVLKENV